MKYFQATNLSPRVAVGPPWDVPDDDSAEVILVIEPGMAFGTGTHETTKLCAILVDEIVGDRNISTMLDVGCGSAILSMAAAGLGVSRVVGIDVDDTAVGVAIENIEKNQFSSEEIELSTTALADIDETFELVVANILANILLELRDDLFRVVAPGGELLLSGIADHQIDDMKAAFEHPDFEIIESRQDGEWIALHLKRREEN